MEAGEFSAKAVQFRYAYTSNGNEQVAVEIEFTDGPNKGRSLTWYGNFGDDIAGEHTRTEWTEIDLKKLGWDGKDWIRLDGLGSKTVRVKVEEDEYNGKVTMKIRRIFAGGGLAVKNVMSEEAVKALAKRLASGKSSSRKTAAEDDDTDVPF